MAKKQTTHACILRITGSHGYTRGLGQEKHSDVWGVVEGTSARACAIAAKSKREAMLAMHKDITGISIEGPYLIERRDDRVVVL